MKDDTISRAAALDALGERPTVWTDDDDYALGERNQYDMDRLAIETVPSATDTNVGGNLIDRQAAIKAADSIINRDTSGNNDVVKAMTAWQEYIKALPSAQPGQRNAIVFQGIVVEYPSISAYPEYEGKPYFSIKYTENGQEFIGYGTYKPEVLSEYLKKYFMPSAQPERTCVNCGRTVNNGGWYADGGTRCPIEEHYALPKDGFCHLWEKRNVTDDDYPERRTDD